jgi:hypothetical protein
MKKLACALVAGTSLWLSGCGSLTSADIATIVADTQKICKFVPTAETIINIINSGGPIVGGAEAIANAICNTVGQPPATTTAIQPHVSGPHGMLWWNGRQVQIMGHFK